MSPRASLPGADELFRATSPAGPPETTTRVSPFPEPPDDQDTARPAPMRPRRSRSGERASTGRERHEEKITVYVSAAELVDLERARLTLRAEHGIAVDRGRIVREALSVLLADLDGKAGESILVRRLAGS
jgi:hypothetical protein